MRYRNKLQEIAFKISNQLKNQPQSELYAIMLENYVTAYRKINMEKKKEIKSKNFDIEKFNKLLEAENILHDNIIDLCNYYDTDNSNGELEDVFYVG